MDIEIGIMLISAETYIYQEGRRYNTIGTRDNGAPPDRLFG